MPPANPNQVSLRLVKFRSCCIIDSFSGKNQEQGSTWIFAAYSYSAVHQGGCESPEINAFVRGRMLVQGVASGWT